MCVPLFSHSADYELLLARGFCVSHCGDSECDWGVTGADEGFGLTVVLGHLASEYGLCGSLGGLCRDLTTIKRNQGGPGEGWVEGGLPATHSLVQGSISPWAPPAEWGPCLDFPDYLGPEAHAPWPPAPLPTRAPGAEDSRPRRALASSR